MATQSRKARQCGASMTTRCSCSRRRRAWRLSRRESSRPGRNRRGAETGSLVSPSAYQRRPYRRKRRRERVPGFARSGTAYRLDRRSSAARLDVMRPDEQGKRGFGNDARNPRLLRAAVSSAHHVARRNPGRAQLLRHLPSQGHAGRAGRFRPDQPKAHAPFAGSGKRANGAVGLF